MRPLPTATSSFAFVRPSLASALSRPADAPPGPTLATSSQTPSPISTTGQTMLQLMLMSRLLSRSRTLLPGGVDQIRARDGGLHRGCTKEIRACHAPQVIRRHLEQPLLEVLARLSREPGRPVGRLTAALDVRRFERIDVAAGAQDRFFERLRFDF